MRPIRFLLHLVLHGTYATTCLLTVAWRSLLPYLVMWLVGLSVFYPVVFLIALIPILRGICAFVAPFSPGPFLRWQHGLRKPSPREQEAIEAVLSRVDRSANRPQQILVLDGPGTRAATVGTTVVLERGLFAHWLPGAIAHEVGLLQTASPARQLAQWWSHPQALLALAQTLRPTPVDVDGPRPGLARRLLAFALRRFDGSNALGELLVRFVWPPLTKRDVYAADLWAAENGFGEEVAAFLQATRLPVDFASPWPWLSETPGTEKRLARLSANGTAGTSARHRPILEDLWKTK